MSYAAVVVVERLLLLLLLRSVSESLALLFGVEKERRPIFVFLVTFGSMEESLAALRYECGAYVGADLGRLFVESRVGPAGLARWW